MELLLSRNAEIEAKEINGWTALMWACHNGRTAAMEILLRHGAKTEAKNSDAWTPLMSASRGGEIAVMEVLLRHGAKVEAKSSNEETPLMLAIGSSDEAIELLLRHGANINAKDREGSTALCHAISDGNTAAMELLLRHGADIEAEDISGETPLVWALSDYELRIGVVEILVRHGAKVNNINGRARRLIRAISNWDTVAMANWLYHYEHRYHEGETLLQWAMRSQDHHFMNLLIQNGTDIEARDNYGRTPLGWASQQKNTRKYHFIKAMEGLLHHGA